MLSDKLSENCADGPVDTAVSSDIQGKDGNCTLTCGMNRVPNSKGVWGEIVLMLLQDVGHNWLNG